MWVTVEDVAAAAGISTRAVQHICKSWTSLGSALWYGHALTIRTIHGRGGRSGIQYQVKVSSLPPHLQDRLKALQSDLEARSKLRLGDDQARLERAWKYDVILPALAHSVGSAERRAEIDKLDGVKKLDWTGQYRKLARSTLYAWIDTYEAEGIHGLAKRVRKDKGAKRVYISRAWDDAVPFDDGTKATIAKDFKLQVRSLVAGDSTLDWTLRLASGKLVAITKAYGFTVEDEAERARVFEIPRKFVDDEHAYKAVARHRKDRKASEDDRPRIKRTTANLEPMEIVVMDVHHINVNVARKDGTYSTPKLIAFHDIATNRVFCEVIQFDDRGGVRNADIITAFVNMCKNPAFGVPQYLYVDNGSEYGFADDLEDALKLGSKQIVTYSGGEERNHVIRAKAYNAAAKHVEGWFRQFNQQYARHIQGWRDDDPMNPKRPQMGKLHDPYPHGFEAFCDELFGLLTAYEYKPQSGALKGKSPALAFKAFVNKGWRANILDPEQLLTVFTRVETRVVRQHGISVVNKTWTCDELLSFFGRTVQVHIPKYHGFGALLVTDEYGATIGLAIASEEYDVLDPRGAQESARRVSVRNKALTKLKKSVPQIDVGAEIIAYGAAQLPVIPNEPDALISVSGPETTRRAKLPVAAQQMSRAKEEERMRAENEIARNLMAQISRPRSNRDA